MNCKKGVNEYPIKDSLMIIDIVLVFDL